MHDNRTHPLLEQIPLTVSPFVSLPTATTLPYTYKTLPSTLPPSATGIPAASSTTANGSDMSSDANNPQSSDADPLSANQAAVAAAAAAANKPRYVISASGHAAHPDDIVASCRALQAHLAALQADADAELRALDAAIRARELAEKRRVAPGWLDSEARLLEPERTGGSSGAGTAVEGGAGDGAGTVGREQQGGVGIAAVQGRMAALSVSGAGAAASEMAVPDEGEELDRAFGVVGSGR